MTQAQFDELKELLSSVNSNIQDIQTIGDINNKIDKYIKDFEEFKNDVFQRFNSLESNG